MNCRKTWTAAMTEDKILAKAIDYEKAGHWSLAAIMLRRIGRIEEAQYCELMAQAEAL